MGGEDTDEVRITCKFLMFLETGELLQFPKSLVLLIVKKDFTVSLPAAAETQENDLVLVIR